MVNKNKDKVLEAFSESDMDFYERFLKNLTDEELQRFMEENPDFLSDSAE